MGKQAPRHDRGELRHRLPLPSERPMRPWFAVPYVDERGSLIFEPDGTGTIDGVAMAWSNDLGLLRVTTPAASCEGALGPNSAWLRCVTFEHEGGVNERVFEHRPD